MQFKLSRRLILSTSALAAGLASPAYAQNMPTNPEATPASEQQPTAARADTGNTGDIIVTARRIEERLQDVPISITVFNQGELNNRNVTTGTDLATYTPSLTANSRFGQNNASFAIRGFTQEIRTAPSVGVYFAEVTAPRAGLVGSYFGEGAGPGLFFDLQNVQVLKGPQGTLFGRNTTGGAILLVPQRPTDSLEGYVEGTIGNLALRRLQGVLNLPVNDSIKLRFGADYEKRDGYLKNISGIGPRRFGDRDRFALRASVLIDLTPDIENYTIGYYQKSSDNGVIPVVTQCNNSIPINTRIPILGPLACQQIARQAGRSPYTVQNAMPDALQELRQWQVINATKWRVSDSLTVRNIASYGQFKALANNPTFGEYLFGSIAGQTLPPTSPVFFSWSYPANKPTGPGGLGVGGPLLPRANQWTATEEFQLVGSMSRLEWQAGVYYEKSKSIGLSGANSASFAACPGNPPAIQTGTCIAVLGPSSAIFSPAINTSKFQDVGVYAQATYALLDNLKITGGIRYTWDKVAGSTVAATQRAIGGTFTCTFAPLVGPTVINPATGNPVGAPISNLEQCRISPRTKSSAPTWIIDLDYFPIPDVMVYAKYSRGYRQGTVNIFAAPVAPFDVIKPEKVDVYEVGTKASWHGSMPGSINVAAFYNKFTNQQILLGLEDRAGITPGFPLGNRATSTATVVNVGASTIKGIEADGSVRLAEVFTLSGSAAYLDTKVKSITIPAIPVNVPYNTLVQTVFKGSPLPFTPKWKVTLTGALDVPVPEDFGKVNVSGTFAYSSRLLVQAGAPGVGVQLGDGTFVPNVFLPSVSTWNFNVNWNSIFGAPVDVSAFVINATDKLYYLSYNNRNSVGFASQIPAEPRTFGVRVRYRFGN